MKRIRSLDILKFIMAILIVFHHYQQNTGMRGSVVNFYDGTIYWGTLVEMFFIISGFLSALGIEKVSKQSFKSYILNKMIRLYPMAMISVCFTAVSGLIYVALIKKWFFDIRITLWKFWNSLLLTFAGGAVDDGLGINNPLWYLCVLLYCYVILYFIIWFFDRHKINCVYGFALMSILGLSVLQYNIRLPFLNEYSGRGYAAFFLGMILAYIWNAVSHKILIMYSSVILLISVIVYFGAYSLFAANMRDVFTYIIFPAVLFITLGADRFSDGRLTKRFEFGGLAYEIYLWHSCGICVWMLISQRWGMINIENYYMMFVFTGLLIIFSAVMYHMVEKRITRYLIRKTG